MANISGVYAPYGIWLVDDPIRGIIANAKAELRGEDWALLRLFVPDIPENRREVVLIFDNRSTVVQSIAHGDLLAAQEAIRQPAYLVLETVPDKAGERLDVVLTDPEEETAACKGPILFMTTAGRFAPDRVNREAKWGSGYNGSIRLYSPQYDPHRRPEIRAEERSGRLHRWWFNQTSIHEEVFIPVEELAQTAEPDDLLERLAAIHHQLIEANPTRLKLLCQQLGLGTPPKINAEDLRRWIFGSLVLGPKLNQ